MLRALYVNSTMPPSETEIVVDDPTAPSDNSPAVTTRRTVEVVVYLLLIGLAILLGFDNWRSGMGWAKDGPQSGYLPFYLCVILAGASLFGLGVAFLRRTEVAFRQQVPSSRACRHRQGRAPGLRQHAPSPLPNAHPRTCSRCRPLHLAKDALPGVGAADA